MDSPLTQPTKLLYFEQPGLREFGARVLAVFAVAQGEREGPPAPPGAAWAVVLDQTAFYPGGGGQPPDQGSIDGHAVLTAEISPEHPGVVLHYLAGSSSPEEQIPPPLSPGRQVDCSLDWDRRFDFMQQHTGQHIVSAVAMRDFGSLTTGFHLGEETATVDLLVSQDRLVSATAMERFAAEIERRAAAEVFADRPVRIRMIAAPGGGQQVAGETAMDGAAGPASGGSPDPSRSRHVSMDLDLRVRERGPAPKGGETWRVIELEQLDLSPCGGTHVSSTGQVGLITVQGWEKIRDSLRLHFSCGYRALSAARWRHADLRRLAQHLTAHERDAVDQAMKLLADAEATRKQLGLAKMTLLGYEAAELAAGAEALPGGNLVVLVRPNLGIEELKIVATAICRAGGAVALLASTQDVPRLVFARSENLPAINAGQLLSEAMKDLGARGGGSPKLAQGGGGDPAKLDAALEAVAGQVRAILQSEGRPGPGQ